jgi:cytochrome oxidase Cu insertion factor (SCO1/SenC/PrrC family)
MTPNVSGSPWPGRRRLLLLAALFALPLVAASVLYFSGWRPARTANFGTLIEPPRPIAAGTFRTLDGGTLAFSALRGKWTLVYIGEAECTSPCIAELYKMRQAVAAQGREAGRVQRVFVVTDNKALDLLRYTLKDYPGMQVLVGPAGDIVRLVRQFAPQEPAGGIYLMDPLGNVMLKYLPDADATGLRKDLARLLRVSQVG